MIINGNNVNLDDYLKLYKENLQYIAVLYKIDSIISSPTYHYNFKLGIPVKTGDVQD